MTYVDAVTDCVTWWCTLWLVLMSWSGVVWRKQGKKLPHSQEGGVEAEVSDEDEAADSGQTANNVNNNMNSNNNNNNNEGGGGGGGCDSQAQEGVRSDKKHSKIKLSQALSRLTSMKSVSFKDTDQAASVGVLGCSSWCFFACVSAYLSMGLSVNFVCFYQFCCLFICLCPSVFLSLPLFIYLSVSVCLYLSFSDSVCLFLFLFLCAPVCLSLSLSASVCLCFSVSDCLSFPVFVCLCLYFSASVCLFLSVFSVSASVRLFLSLSASVSFCLCLSLFLSLYLSRTECKVRQWPKIWILMW